MSPEDKESLEHCGLTVAEAKVEGAKITTLQKSGCTYHCASGQVWGGQPCVCLGDGTGHPYHSMNPPPGGWPNCRSVVMFDAARALSLLRKALGLSLLDAAETHLGISCAELSALERGTALTQASSRREFAVQRFQEARMEIMQARELPQEVRHQLLAWLAASKLPLVARDALWLLERCRETGAFDPREAAGELQAFRLRRRRRYIIWKRKQLRLRWVALQKLTEPPVSHDDAAPDVAAKGEE